MTREASLNKLNYIHTLLKENRQLVIKDMNLEIIWFRILKQVLE